jgi:hypothetical protein
MFITMIGNSFHAQDIPPVEDLIYSLRFEIDHASVESGTYVYGPENSSARRLGSSEVGLTALYDLRVRIKTRNANYKSAFIDINSVMQKLRSTPDLEGLLLTGEKGSSAIVVKVSSKSIEISYHVHKDYTGPQNQFYFKTKVFALGEYVLA